MSTEWPEKQCDCEIVLRDGEVHIHVLNAGLSIARHLANQAGNTGQLILFSHGETICYPIQNVQKWSLKNERDR